MNAKPLALVLALAAALSAPSAQAAPLQLSVGGAVLQLDAPDGYSRIQLVLSGPAGELIERSFAADQGSRLSADLRAPSDGAWRYRLSFEGAKLSVASGSDDLDGRAATAARAWPVLSGQFALSGGALVPARSEALPPEPRDQLINDDLIVTGGICVGLDCVDGEAFNFITIKLKENNIRLDFDDTSTGAFPADDWSLEANDTASGGANRFSIANRTTATTPFTLRGGAPDHAIYVDATGRVGFRNATPVLDLHPVNSNTPGTRLEQSGAGGFTPQTWDVAGNEANFFIRDVTGGSTLPFRIRPGAPSSAIDISASGNVGIGTASPGARLDIVATAPLATPTPLLRVRNIQGDIAEPLRDRFIVDSNGNVSARGTISQLSSRATKENFSTLEGPLLLAKLEALPVPAWNYRDASAAERHIGPMAEDFHASFGVGADPRFLAPGDVAGVALASVKALQEEVKQRDARINELEQRLQRLEALLVESR